MNKKQNLHTGAELKRYVGAVLEEVKDGFKVAQEQSLSINQRLYSMEKTLDEHTKILHKNSNILLHHSQEIENLRMDIIEVKSKLTHMNLFAVSEIKNKVDKKHFVDLEGRVRILEKS